MREFLAATPIVDWEAPEVLALAGDLARGVDDPVAVARRCFEWVRDEVKHSGDHRLDAVTCSASEVLRRKEGLCYAKSHLLAALLRANGIPAGFGYQRLSADAAGTTFRLHGFNAIHLPGFGWYRADPRGNREGVATAFDPPTESLAFTPRIAGEETFDAIWPEPLEVVVEALSNSRSGLHLAAHLPDLEPARAAAV
jgi:transglutaminase-like putative cysteine protease